jgi:multidrug efflux pump subunit AcrB
MIGIVKIALGRPLTFIVMAILLLILGVIAAFRTPVDIFPNINIPVIAVVWQYNGLSAEDMSGRIVNNYERTLTTTVNDIEHIESQSFQGTGIVKIYFQPGADIRIANAQVTAISQSVLRSMPQGVTPPLVLNYSASTVPIIQLALSGSGLSEQQLFDLGFTNVRPQLITVPGAASPYPSGGKQRQVQIDLDPAALQAKGLSAQDVVDAIAAQNQITPVGFAKLGRAQYNVKLNNAPTSIAQLNDIPIRTVNGATILMRDVAQVRDGSGPQTNIVHVEGRRSVLMTILKNGSVSTLAIIDGIKARLAKIREGLPASATLIPVGDQSVFVRAAVSGVINEGALAAVLTSLMILLFLGSWRSTVIVAISIPLAVLSAIVALAACGQTLNVMTLGGLALAVGILVDEATVTIENINWHLEQGKPVLTAIIDGATQIVMPAFVSMLCICIVFIPMFFLPGVAGFLFVPLALSVIFAMIASFLLSRTLLPTMAMYLLRPHITHGEAENVSQKRNIFVRFQRGFEMRFERFRNAYLEVLTLALIHRRGFMALFLGGILATFALVPTLGSNFFPAVDAGEIVMHFRVSGGVRIEQTAIAAQAIEEEIRQIIPPHDLASVADNVGLPNSGINVVYSNSGTIGPQDGDILLSLVPGHSPTANYVAQMRRILPQRFPNVTFSFLPSDITSQILNFGAPAPIDLQVSGRNLADDQLFATKLLRKLRTIPGVADARLQQAARTPQLNVAIDRQRIGQFGLSERDVTNGVAGTLAGSGQTSPVFFLNPENGVSYPVIAQAPEYRIGTIDDLKNVPVSGSGTNAPQVLGSLASFARASTASVMSRYNLQPVFDIYATPQGRDLGAVAADIGRAIKQLQPDAPKGVTVAVRGQVETMNIAFTGLGLGLIAAIILIYLLIVVNFQSWLDPLVIITALPAAIAGIIWMLFLTQTTLSVPALTGAIMCMGVATANSILVVSFAREQLNISGDAVQAALQAGRVRFRPVLMTALAMIIGMTPMALGLGEGGEQNAPLGRAVIGGLMVATIATLIFVPAFFSFVHRKSSKVNLAQKELSYV